MIPQILITMNHYWYPIIHINSINKPDILKDSLFLNPSNTEIYKKTVWYCNKNDNNYEVKVKEMYKEIKDYNKVLITDVNYEYKLINKILKTYDNMQFIYPNCWKIYIPNQNTIYMFLSPINSKSTRLFLYNKTIKRRENFNFFEFNLRRKRYIKDIKDI